MLQNKSAGVILRLQLFPKEFLLIGMQDTLLHFYLE